MKWSRRLMSVVVSLAVGAGLLLLFIADRQVPEKIPQESYVADLRFINVASIPLRIEARGYGEARPAETWQAIANVAGRVVERHPELESGTLLQEGTILLKLDPSRYELAISEAEADLESLTAELGQLEIEQQNTRRLLALEKESLALAERELSRIERLAESGSVSVSRRDDQLRNTVSQRQAVASLENSLDLIPARREVLESQRERAAVRLAQAQKDLDDTIFVAPYDLRLGDVQVELHQYAASGQHLFDAESISAAEVEAHVPFSMLRRLLSGVSVSKADQWQLDISERMEFSSVNAEVVLAGASSVRWSAQLTRVSSGLDPTTRTARVIVRVQDPYRNAFPPDRPPLQRGMYVQVQLTAEADDRIAIPATAVHDGQVFVLDSDDRVRFQEVEVSFEQHDLAIISSGLNPGDRLIVDDPVPVFEGMQVTPQHDQALEEQLKARAEGDIK
ncbi:MAG: efflux RND transporter periplasmic adaptor subunit [Marinobacter sp.]|uniref:efflux RND transporter periplasmic adaptor subunit n=1 Tax=Marinobacter sp. TaxID=50741 RepID=UPI00396E27FD